MSQWNKYYRIECFSKDRDPYGIFNTNFEN